MNSAVGQIKRMYGELPTGMRKFAVRAILLFIGWRLLYHFVLEPTDFPDKQLIDLILIGTSQMLHLFYDKVNIIGDTIFINGHNTLTVAKACNGLELIVLYLGFLFCVPTTSKRLILFALLGPLMICALNIIRCTALGVMFYNNHSLADFAHHYVFKLAIYAAIFGMWIWYSKKYKGHEA